MNLHHLVRRFEYKELFLIGFYLSFISITAIAMAADAFFGHYFDMAVEGVFVTLSFAGFVYFVKTQNHIVAARIIIWIGSVLAFILVYHSDYNITIIFTLLLPIGAFVLMTPKEALINMPLYYLALAALLGYGYLQREAHPFLHNPETMTPYIIAMLFTVAFGLFYNFAIEESHRRLKRANAEKEILLQEIHHRVKNNLNVIASIIDLQARSNDEVLAQQLSLTRGRIESIAIVHEMLYKKQEDFARIDFETYTLKLADTVVQLHGLREVTYVIEGQGILIPVNVMVDLGMIINELLTNTHKHAFAHVAEPRVRISLTALESGRYRFTYRDNGPGIAAIDDVMESNSLGLRLIRLSVRKMDGSLQIRNDGGFVAEIEFPLA